MFQIKRWIFLVVLLLPVQTFSQLSFDVETGIVFSGYNDVRIPGDIGTFFSLSNELKTDPSVYYRIKGNYQFEEKHNIGILFAPLTLNASGALSKNLTFNGQTFAANTDLKGTYRFNSYRITYRYDFVQTKTQEFGLGFTGKIRDAEIAAKAGGGVSSKKNVGFVPLINFRYVLKIDNGFRFLFEGDALAAPQGRAEDILIALESVVSEKQSLKFGYRLVEGGADNDEVYNFALINYLVAGWHIRF